jgi:LPS-assembly lipoprotein
MTLFRNLTVLTFALLTLSACGFTPMYAENSAGEGVPEDFASISIAPIQDRIGQVVRNHLLDRINPYGQPAVPQYVLRVSLQESVEGFGFRSDEAVTRESFTLTAVYQLVEQSSGDVVLQDELRAVQAYDVVQSDFANFSTQQDAEARTAQQVADLLTARLGLYFKSKEQP